MKRPWIIIVIATGAIIGLIYLTLFKPRKQFDAAKIFTAAQTYTRTLRATHSKIPPTVNLKTLIERGFLRPNDVKSFDGLDVTISLLGDPSNPQAVLMRVHFPDGQDLVVVGDGSIQNQTVTNLPRRL